MNAYTTGKRYALIAGQNKLFSADHNAKRKIRENSMREPGYCKVPIEEQRPGPLGRMHQGWGRSGT